MTSTRSTVVTPRASTRLRNERGRCQMRSGVPECAGSTPNHPPTNLSQTNISCFQNFLPDFLGFSPALHFPPFARSENPIVFHAETCFDGWVSGEGRQLFSQGLFLGPMSSLPAIYSIRLGVHAPHPTRYRPPAMSAGHP
jgi:hypothetical protein